LDNDLLGIREFITSCDKYSVDLDFNLLDQGKEDVVYKKIRKIVLKYGLIADEAKKYFGPILVLDYGIGERKLKIEISNRNFNDTYEIKNLLGINVKVMVQADMFAHKLCTLLDRTELTNRDIFDSWFFMNVQSPVNTSLIESRMGMPYINYMDKCIQHLEGINHKGMLAGLGELMDNKTKSFVRNKLLIETITLLKFYKEFPI